MMEQKTDLTDFVPPTPHDSPLSGGHAPGSDEGRPNLLELMNICTKLSNRVLEAKTTQDKVITRLKLRVRRLEKKRKAKTSQPMKRRLFKGRVETSTNKSLGEDVSKQGRNDDQIYELNLTNGADTEVNVEDKGSGEKDGSTADQVSTARPENLIKMRSEKAKEKGVAFRDMEEPPRLTRLTTTLQPLLTINLKDKEFDEIQARMDADHELANNPVESIITLHSCFLLRSLPRVSPRGDFATWDGGKTTWGGRVEAMGTVPVCVCAQESWGEGTGVVAGKSGKGTVWGRNDDQTKELNLTNGADTEVIVEDKGSGEKGGSTADQVSTTRPEVSAVTPSTPLTTTTIFGDEDLTISHNLIKMRKFDIAQKERKKQEEATIAALTEEFDEIQARMDVDHELVVRMTHKEQEMYTIKEMARLLEEYIERRKKQLPAKRAEAIRNKPPTRTQVRNRMITYLKHMEKRYPLIKEILEKMLNWKLESKAESTIVFELLKFIKSQIEE
nr:hypothetical protein [Tanacetum cinerariifolium]